VLSVAGSSVCGMASGSPGAVGEAGAGVATQERVADAERRLLVALAAWSTWSLGVGATLWRLGRGNGGRALGAGGRTTVAWGLADAAVVGWGAWRAVRRPGAPPAVRARRLALLTGANALLDVGYVAAGAGLSTRPRRRGEGVATACQGLFLLYLDTRYSLEFAAAARNASASGPPRPLDSARARDRRRPALGGGAGPGGNDSVVVRTVS
jgi:hypothetical protein